MSNSNASQELTGPSNLDHALLESLFYNEMVMMDESASMLPNSLFDTISTGSHQSDNMLTDMETSFGNTSNPLESNTSWPQVIAEKALLHDFGVTHTPLNSNHWDTSLGTLLPPPASYHIDNSTASKGIRHTITPQFTASVPIDTNVVNGQMSMTPNPLAMEATTNYVSFQQSIPIDFQQHYATSSLPAVPNPLNVLQQEDNLNRNIYPTHQVANHNPTKVVDEKVVAKVESVRSSAAPVDEDKKRRKLLSQFATLASRLGITLPQQVLHAGGLSGVGSLHLKPLTVASSTVKQSKSVAHHDTAKMVDTRISQTEESKEPAGKSAALEELRSTALESLAAVTRKRSESFDSSDDSTANDGKKGTAISTGKNFSKRRKKPKLNECEAKLASLRAENDMLKRHLDNISNQTTKLEQERVEVEKKMRQMFEEGAPDDEIDSIVRNYADMYSDYGKKRDQELTFHLEQLQRLANPTNFTKMGLWTLGQQSKDTKNPIAGILQKELGITSQQGRKILEQRQKIQSVCANLKECLVLLGTLKSLCEQKTKIFHHRMEKCREILSPRQVVKLLIWINENSSTLGSVCPGWGSEQFQAKTKKKF